jgi:hypothetical protein
MQSLSSKKHITIKAQNTEHNMSLDEYARWLSLLEGIEFVGKRVEQLKVRTNVDDIDWIKPLAFQKYIEERFESMKSDLSDIESQGLDINITPCTTSPVPVLS